MRTIGLKLLSDPLQWKSCGFCQETHLPSNGQTRCEKAVKLKHKIKYRNEMKIIFNNENNFHFDSIFYFHQ